MCENELLNESILLDSLPDLKRVHLFEEIDSTSDFGKQLAKSDDQFPALIYARRQTKGRGRGDKKWLSDRNSMTFSFVIDSHQIGLNPSQSSIVWGTSLAQTLNDLCGVEGTFKIKWPNDVMANDAKVAGILIESVFIDRPIQVIGIGINLANDSQELVSASKNQSIRPISVREATGTEIQPVVLLKTLWNQYVSNSQLNMSDLLTMFRSIDFLQFANIRFQHGESVFAGDYVGVQDDGSIQLRLPDRVVEFQSGSVLSFSRPS